jgi:aspartate aminotransferase
MGHILDSISFGAIVQVRDRLLEQQAAGRKIYRLESGDPSFDLPVLVRDAITEALAKGLTHYTASAGVQPLREAIVKKVKRDNALPVDGADQVVVTSGGMHALYLTFMSLLDPGDEVVIPDPMWTEIAENIRLAGGVPVRAPMDLDAPIAWTAEIIERHMTPRTKAIFVNTPQNPTGLVIPREELVRIAELAARRDVQIISDEAYEHVIFDGREHVSIGSLPGAWERTHTLFSTSKSYAMSGLRVGYIVSPNNMFLERVRKLLRCTTNGVNSIAQYGAAAAMKTTPEASKAMGVEYGARRDALLAGLRGIKVLHPIVPQGTFFMWLRIDPSWGGYKGQTDDWAMTQFLIDQGGVGSSPGTAFGPAGAGCIRLAYSCDRPQVEDATRVIRGLLA